MKFNHRVQTEEGSREGLAHVEPWVSYQALWTLSQDSWESLKQWVDGIRSTFLGDHHTEPPCGLKSCSMTLRYNDCSEIAIGLWAPFWLPVWPRWELCVLMCLMRLLISMQRIIFDLAQISVSLLYFPLRLLFEEKMVVYFLLLTVFERMF